MKLKKLIIHNIASIVDATIDFEAPELANESLFLICGETGAGKTTILDSICLALYDTTPRMKASVSEKYTSDGDHVADDLTTSDARQLMRRGASEAKVSLDFEGNDGVNYTVEWEVHRKHKKQDGNLQDCARYLINHRTGVEMTGKKEINKAIVQAIQLNADQFTRTVILPQGQFSQFMQSKADDKSSILEKLTGLNQYTLIGKRIFDIYTEKKHEWEREDDKMQGIKVLTAEEIQEKETTIENLRKQEQEASRQQKAASDKLSWLGNVRKAKEDKATAESELNRSLVAASTLEAQAEALLVKQWDATAQIRAWINDINGNERDLNNLQKEAEIHHSDYHRLIQAQAWHENVLKEHQKERDDNNVYLMQEEPNRPMYDNKLSIVNRVKDFEKKEHDYKEASDNLAKDSKKLPAARDVVKQAEDDMKAAKKAFEAAKGQTDELDAKIERMNLREARQRREELNKLQNKIVGAENAITTMEDRSKSLRDAEEDNRHKTQAFEQALQREPELEKAATLAKEKADEAEKRLQKAELRVKDWMKEARAMLSVGDDCPLCGHVIDKVLGNEQTESLLGDVRQEKTSADDKLIKAKADLQAAKTHSENAKKDCEKAQAALEQARLKAKESEKAVLDAVRNCGIEVAVNEAAPKLQQLKRDIEAELKPLKETVEQGEKLEKELKDLRKVSDTKQEVANKAKDYLQRKSDELSQLESSIITQTQLLSALVQEKQRIVDDLNTLVTHSQWKGSWSTQPKAFVQWLEKQATEFSEKAERMPILERTIVNEQNELNTMVSCRQRVEQILTPASRVTVTPSRHADAVHKWEELKDTVVTWNERIAQITKSTSDKNRQIDEKVKSIGIERTRVEELAHMSQSSIYEIKTAHEERDKRQQQLKGSISTLENQLAKLHSEGEQLIEENDETTLNDLVANNKHLAAEASQKIGAEQALLTENKNKVEELRETIKKVEQLRVTMEQWEGLKNMLGDEVGKKFRKIAQSFILGDLIYRANAYLRQFSDRLVLSHEPGTLTILVRDIMQGQQPLSTSTLSGGESFMVSLSLALALAQMNGNAFSMDTLFIDEGFGTLSGEYLDTVMQTLERLHALGGRRVGIISHVEGLQRIKTQIRVQRDKNDSTRSNVTICTS